jgi:hypothetical protein
VDWLVPRVSSHRAVALYDVAARHS